MPVFLECQRCTACCQWPGQVRITEKEIEAMASHLGLTGFDFIQSHTRLSSDRRGLALNEQPGGACVFLADGACLVQPVKPRQCRDFPNLWSHPDAAALCRALPLEVTEEEWMRRVTAATGRTEAELQGVEPQA